MSIECPFKPNGCDEKRCITRQLGNSPHDPLTPLCELETRMAAIFIINEVSTRQQIISRVLQNGMNVNKYMALVESHVIFMNERDEFGYDEAVKRREARTGKHSQNDG